MECVWSWSGALRVIYDFQTLITGVLAVIGVYFAARPAWRQVALISRQVADMERARILAYHDVLTKAISLLELNDWPKAEDRAELIKPESEQKNINALGERVVALRNLRTAMDALPLHADDAEMLKKHFDAVGKLFREQYEPYPTSDRWLKKLKGNSVSGCTELWFWCVDQPDTVVKNALGRKARQTLDAKRTALVAQLS